MCCCTWHGLQGMEHMSVKSKLLNAALARALLQGTRGTEREAWGASKECQARNARYGTPNHGQRGTEPWNARHGTHDKTSITLASETYRKVVGVGKVSRYILVLNNLKIYYCRPFKDIQSNILKHTKYLINFNEYMVG